MGKLVECKTPGCINKILLKEGNHSYYVFCPKCKEAHSPEVLRAQVEHGKPIREIILDAKIFKSSNGMADYIGISFVTMYKWLEKYFGMSFQEFKREYICKSSKCYLLNIRRSTYSRNDYILKKIRTRSPYCACINGIKPDHIMTNCPQGVVSSILRGYPRISRISDDLFALAPKPVFFKRCIPVHFMK